MNITSSAVPQSGIGLLKERRKPPPVRIVLVLVLTIFTSISIGVTFLLSLPWFFLTAELGILIVALILLATGFSLIYVTLRSLKLHRAFGSEIYQDKADSQLITTGVYSHTRNPLYLSSIVLFFGWTLLTRLTPLLIMSLLFTILFVRVALWEEEELTERFGQEYSDYKSRVPFMIPFPKRRREQKEE